MSERFKWRFGIKALLLLYRLKAKGSLRSLWRSSKSLPAALRNIGTLVFLSILLVPAAITWFGHERLVENSADTAKLVEFGLPIFLAMVFYTTIISPKKDNYLHFSDAEIGFLFPAPFSRRQLLLYRLLSIFTATFWLSFFITAGGSMFLVRENFWFSLLTSFCGVSLALLLVQLFLVLMGLIGTSVKVRLYNPSRKLVAVGVSILVLLMLFSVRGQTTWDGLKLVQNPQDLIPLVDNYVNSTAGKILLGPFKIFSNLVLAGSFSAFALWGAACVLINLAVGYLIIRLDANYLETSVLASQKRAELIKSQTVETVFASSSVGTLPMLPAWNGLGPIAWRQLQTFYRTWKVGIFYFVFVLLLLGVVIWADHKRVSSVDRFWIVTTFMGMIVYIGAVAVPIGFQADLHRMDILKSLPASSFRIAAGQILGPTIVLTMIQYLYVAIFAVAALDQWPKWLILVATMPLVNFLVLSISNTMALLLPARSEPSAAKQFENVGSALIFMLVVTFISMTLSAFIGGAGALIFMATKTVFIAVLTGWLVLLTACAAGAFFASKAFEMFDVSKSGT